MKSKIAGFTAAGTVAYFIASGGAKAQTTLNWTGGSLGGNSNMNSAVNWDPSTDAPSALTLPPDLVIATRAETGSIATLLTGGSYSVRSLTFDNSEGRFNPTNGLRIGPTTSASSTVANVMTFKTAAINIMSAANNATVTLNRYPLNTAGASQTYNLDYTGLASIAVDATSSITFSDVAITGSGGLIKTGAGSLNFTGVTGTLRNFSSGGFQILGGTVSTNSNLALGEYATLKEDAVVINGGTLSYTNTSVITNVVNRGMQVGANTGTIELATGNLRLSNSIGDVAGQAGIFRRTGGGNLSIEAGTTHTGGTLLESGQLTLANNGTLGGSGGVGITVAADAVFRGSGTINGNSSFAGNSTLRIDGMNSTTGVANSVATLAVNGDLTFGDVNFLFDLDEAGISDLLAVNGTIDIGAGLLDLDSFTFTAASGFGPGIYTLFSSTEILSGSLGSNLTGFITDYEVNLGFSDDGKSLLLTAIPEPSAALLGGLGLLMLLTRGRRR